MELLLEVRVGVGEESARIDCRVSIDSSTTVADLVGALLDHARARELAVAGDEVLWSDRGEAWPGDLAVHGSGIRSGARVWLAGEPPAVSEPPPSVEVSVAGPAGAGPVVLASGRYRIGADLDAALVLPGDAPAFLAEVAVGPSGDVEIRDDSGAVWELEAADLGGVGRSVGIGAHTIRLRPARPVDSVDSSGGVLFNRTPHRPVPLRPRPLDPLPPPPSPPATNRIAITSFLVPLVSGIGFAVVLGRPQFLLLALAAPVVLLVVGAVERRRGRTSTRRARALYDQQVEQTIEAGVRALREEAADRVRALPPVDELLLAARTRRPPLWARGRGTPDLLRVRVGTGSDRSAVVATVAAGGDDEIRAEVETRLAPLASVHGVPVGLDLDGVAVVGVFDGSGLPTSATRDAAVGVARAVLAQIVAGHGPEDVVVAALISPAVLWEFEWLRWLPHVRSAASPLPDEHLAIWPDSGARLLGALLDVANDRSTGSPPPGGHHPRLVVVVHEDAPIDRAALGRLLDAAPAVGIRVVWVGADRHLLPRQCRAVVSVAAGDDASELTSTDPAIEPRRFTAEPATVAALDDLARALAPLRDAASVARTGAIPRTVGLTDVLAPRLGSLDVGSIAGSIAAEWRRSDGASLSAPLGLGADGIFDVDLVEQGPHVLVAGTSGSGKSELLQTLVASIAACHPPARATFLFIDYKGGAAAAPFVQLPHHVGSVTNLDATMSRRALTSLRAELERRMAVLAELDDPAVKDLADLARVAPELCPPRLVLVVDEFATLIKEIPDFVDGVVDIAQRGRSLGIHLVLATQRPAGAVNENILANTNLRIALRMVDHADSQNVIGSGDAADIPVPLRGRGFARIGPSDLVPFQTAWAGAPVGDRSARGIEVRPFGFESVAAAPAGDGDGGRQLDRVRTAVTEAFAEAGAERPRRPWLPPLADVVGLDAVAVDRDAVDGGRLAVIGVRDEPRHQRRIPATVDLEACGGLAIFGTGGSGRSTALRTVAASLVQGSTAAQVQLIGLDFAGRSLLPLLHLPHTRAVAGADDLESTARAIDHLLGEIARRRSLLGEASVETLGALRARTGTPVVPRLAILIDGFGALRAELDRPTSYEWLHRLQRVVLDGRAVGIHAVVTADRRSDLPSAILGAMGARLVLRMSEPEAMVALGVPSAVARAADLPAGRGFLDGDHEVQVAVVGGDPAAAEQASALSSWAPADVEPAPRDVPLPDEIARPVVPDTGLRVTFGVGDGGEPATVDLGQGHLLVVGPPGSGRSTALAAVADAFHHPVVRAVRVAVLASSPSPLAEVGVGAGVEVARATDEQIALLDDVLGSVGRDVRVPGTVVVVDDAHEVDDEVARRLEQLAARPGVRIVAAVDTGAVGRTFSGWLPLVHRRRRTLVLQPDDASEVDQVASVRMRFRPGSRFPRGRGVLVIDRRPAVVQVGRPPRD